MICPMMNGRDCSRDDCALWVEGCDKPGKVGGEPVERHIHAHCGLIARPRYEVQRETDGRIVGEGLE